STALDHWVCTEFGKFRTGKFKFSGSFSIQKTAMVAGVTALLGGQVPTFASGGGRIAIYRSPVFG
ncbi:MAG: hypothetical protein AAF965_07890, partial [Pseudomonadota bacterium]